MALRGLSGRVQTVLGIIDPSDLGVTLSHEHILWDASFMYEEPIERGLGTMPVRIENLDWLKRNGLNNVDNLKQVDETIATEELLRYKKMGGSTVVDMGNKGLCRNPEGLARVSSTTGLHVVMGSGYYIGKSHPKRAIESSVDELTEEMVQDITVGVDGTGIRAGVIGEIGCSYPLMDTELKVIEAVASAQLQTGAPVNFHPGQSQSSPIELMELFRGFGGNIGHVAVSHIGNRHGLDLDLTIQLAEMGSYIEYDSFGNYQNPISLPEKTFYALSDWQRIECIKALIEHGFLDRLLISHDVFNKTDLRRWGGFGYDHIQRTVIPMMKMNGITDEEIDAMLVQNPGNFLRFS